jgi:hypothetical protein
VASISNKAGWSIAIAVSLVLAATLAGWVHAGGPLDPPGAPGVTMKSLSEVEPRTPISALPYTISEPGSYYLTGNLSVSTAIDGISVQADDVTIDLNGFELNGNGMGSRAIFGSTTGGFPPPPPRRNWRVYNGAIVGWAHAFSAPTSQVQIDHVRASGIRWGGFTTGAGARVSDCSVESSSTDLNQGIVTGDRSSVESCSTRGFTIGIDVGNNSTVASCNVTAARVGVRADFASTIASCRINAIETGIQADGAILGNQIDMLGATSPASCGIYAGNGAAVDGNRITASPNGVCLSGLGITATRNSFYTIATAAFTGLTGNDVSPVVAAAGATNPLSNICVSPPGTCASTP